MRINKRGRRILGGVAVLTATLALGGIVMAVEEKTAKQIYFESPQGGSAQTSALGVRYSILSLNEDDEIVEVTERHTFSRGDRFRLSFEVNRDGYLYIFSRGEDAPTGERLFPDSRIYGGRNLVKARTGITVPPARRGWFRFGVDEGDENIFVFFSRKPIDDLAALIPAADDDKSISVNATSFLELAKRNAAGDKNTKQIYYDEPEDAGAPAHGYVSVPDGILVHQIVLKRE